MLKTSKIEMFYCKEIYMKGDTKDALLLNKDT